jgi:hypothetical protein
MRFKFFALVLAIAAATVNTARADIAYTMSASQSVNGSVDTVSIYLVETITAGATPYLAPGGQGALYGSVYGINNLGGNAVITSATGAGFTSTSQGSPINNVTVSSGGTAAAFENAAAPGATNSSGALHSTFLTGSTTVSQLLIGTVSITLGTSQTTYNIASPYAGSQAATVNGGFTNFPVLPPSGTDLSFGGTVGTGSSAQSYVGLFDNDSTFGATNSTLYTFIVPAAASTPEPSSMLLCGLAASGMGFGAWRRRKAKLQAEATPVEEVPLAI